MGIHAQLQSINKRNDLLFDVLLVTAAVLEIACIVMVVVIVTSLIRSNRQSLGVIKANGLGSWRIAFSVCCCFGAMLLITGILTIVFSLLIGYILDLTHIGFTEMTSYTITFIWYIAIVASYAVCFAVRLLANFKTTAVVN